MTDYGESGLEHYISEQTGEAVVEILLRSSGLSSDAIQDFMKDIRRAVPLAQSVDTPDFPSKPKNELKKLRKSIANLILSIKGVSKHADFAMWDAAIRQTLDPEVAKFNSDGNELMKLYRSAELIRKASELAIDSIDVPSGHPPNVHARHFAFHVAVAFEQHGLTANSTKDGMYFQVLAELFGELMPTECGEAHERYGRWALKTTTLEETFF